MVVQSTGDQVIDYALESLKLSRAAASDFDVASQRIKGMFLTFTVVLMLTTGLVLSYPGFSDKVTFMFVAASAIVVLSILFWGLDNKYRSHLKVAAALSRQLEAILKGKRNVNWITQELGEVHRSVEIPLDKKVKRRDRSGPKKEEGSLAQIASIIVEPSNLIYLVVALGSVIVLAMVSNNGGYLEDYIYMLIILILTMIGFVIAVISINKGFDDRIERRYGP